MKISLSDKWFHGLNAVILTLVGLSCLLPIIHIISISFSDSGAVMSGKVLLWPVGISSESYKLLLKGTNIVRSFQNSIEITLVGTCLNMIFTIMAAYPLSRKYFVGRRFFTLAIVFTMMFNAGLIPNFILIKSLGLLNSYGALWFLGLVSVWNLLVLRSFFEGIPEELVEAARIDGCNEWKLIYRIFLPLSLPVLAALSLFYGVANWNSFFNVLIYITDVKKYNLSVLVQNMIQSQQLLQEMNNQGGVMDDQLQKITPQTIRAAGILVMITPMLLVYPLLQKYFVKGMLIGSIKG